MQRARRLASTAVVAVLAVSGLSACRNEPDVAAYVGKTVISEDRVNAVYDDAKDKLAASVAQVGADQTGAPAQTPATTPKLQIDRTKVAMTLVGLDVLRRLAQQRQLTAAEVPVAQAAQMVSLPPDAEFVKISAEYRGYLIAFAQALEPSLASFQPTEAELRDVHARLKAGGVLEPPGSSFEEFVQSFSPEDSQQLQKNLALRNALNAEIQKINTTVNPRYGPGTLALFDFPDANKDIKPMIDLTYVAGSKAPAVTDLR